MESKWLATLEVWEKEEIIASLKENGREESSKTTIGEEYGLAIRKENDAIVLTVFRIKERLKGGAVAGEDILEVWLSKDENPTVSVLDFKRNLAVILEEKQEE